MLFCNPQLIKAILSGKEPQSALQRAFVFGLTPQGHDYWAQFVYLKPPKLLNDEAKNHLNTFLSEIEDNEDETIQ